MQHRDGLNIRSLAALPIPLFLVIILAAHLGLSEGYLRRTVFEPLFLLPILNIVFIGVASFGVTLLSAKSYLKSGRFSLILLGSGTLAFGCAGVSAGWFIHLPDGVNKAVTIFNCGALLAGILHFLSLTADIGEVAPQNVPGIKNIILTSGFGTVFLILALITAAALIGWTPVFFVQKSGPTMIRQFVMGAAIMLMLLSGAHLLLLFYRSKTAFYFWYGLGLIAIAEGLTGVSLGRTVGGILGWTGRMAQYTGGIYLLVAVLCTFREKSAEDVLSEVFRQPGELYAAMFGNSLDGMVIAVHDGPVLSANPAATAMLGLDVDALRQMAVNDLFDNDLADHRRFRDELSVHGKARADMVLARGTGNDFPAALSAAVCRDSGGKALEIITFRDISDRKEAERALTAANERIRTILESVTDGFLAVDHEWRLTYFNETGARLVGMNRDDMIGRCIWDLFPYAVSSKFFSEYHRAVETGMPVHFEEYYPGTMNMWLECHGYPNPDGLTVFYRDVTGRKEAEKALREREERISASLAEKEVLLKEIHHRVKNNMQVISSLIALQADGLQDAAGRSFFEDLTHRIRSMAMVHEKLYQSRDLAQIDFAEYAQSLLNYLWRAHADHTSNIRLETVLEPVSLPVHTAVPCGLILNELFSNALKHAFRGRTGGRVTVSLQSSPQGRVRLSVRDNGNGFSPEFDWEQAESLGLRLVRMLAGQIHAAIALINHQGTEFTLRIERRTDAQIHTHC